VGPRPVRLYDHIPEILVGPLALYYSLLALLQLAHDLEWAWAPVDKHTIFWVAAAGTIAWVVSYRWNLSKKNFVLVVALFGFLFGIPAVLEIMGAWRPFATIGGWLQAFAPTASAGAYGFVALCGWGVWLAAFIWSRLNMSATLDESGLTIVRVDGRRERYELIGLKTEADPFDYSERASLGIGSLTLKTRTGKMIFSMKRVIWLYRIPLLFWIPPKIDRIEDVLSYQGKMTVVDSSDRAEMVEAMDDVNEGDEGAVGDEGGNEGHSEAYGNHQESRDEGEPGSEIS
jgi:hypothetical protein